MKILSAWFMLYSISLAQPFYNHLLVDDLNLNLPYFPTTATVSMTVTLNNNGPPITWNVGTFDQSQFKSNTPWTTINPQTAAAAGVDWAVMNLYLSQVSYSNPATIRDLINAGPLRGEVIWEWPHVYPEPWHAYLVELRFKPISFVTEVWEGKNQGYVAGHFEMGFIPEPNPFLMVLTGVLIALAVLRRRK